MKNYNNEEKNTFMYNQITMLKTESSDRLAFLMHNPEVPVQHRQGGFGDFRQTLHKMLG